ncbi:hypothetical protein [Rhizobium tropici]|uniref:EamA family transporter n=1 Tax=Rhizobium tropici TaxID=398 RepID=A0A329Y912_RHITR|nr:hypothetical protein [Rhizobium tropici]RAX40341.1 hypothetical protein DQ393_17120 [Rhizobium tropici]
MCSGNRESRPLAGIALVCIGYACFAMQDAIAKWLVADYDVPEILFMRSFVIVAVSGFLVKYRKHPSIFKALTGRPSRCPQQDMP